jgi:hypothetical protein
LELKENLGRTVEIIEGTPSKPVEAEKPETPAAETETTQAELPVEEEPSPELEADELKGVLDGSESSESPLPKASEEKPKKPKRTHRRKI